MSRASFRRKSSAVSLCKSIESAIQWFLIHHGITFVTIHNPAVYLSGARVSLSPTLVPRLLVYKFKKIMGRTDFSDQFRKIIRHKRIGYDLNVTRQSACLVDNPITVANFAALFNCMPVDRASDSMMAPT